MTTMTRPPRKPARAPYTLADFGEEGDLYLLHFDTPIGGEGRNSAAHYTGFASDGNLYKRLVHHAEGRGASITAHVRSLGGTWVLASVRRGTRTQERRLKTAGHAERRCPVCKGQAPFMTWDEIFAAARS